MYDGSITIDTRLDTRGLNRGVKQIGTETRAGMAGIMGALSGVGAAIGGVFAISKVMAFVQASANAFSWMGSEYTGRMRALDISFMRLQGVVAALWDTLIATFGPYIIDAIGWLITQLTTLIQIVQAVGSVFFGLGDAQKGLNAATDAAGRLTNQTNRMAKAAQGALAGFDELKVLNSKPIIPGVEGPPADMIAKVLEIKKAIDDIIARIADGSIWGMFWEGFTQLAARAWENYKILWGQVWEIIKAVAKQAWENIKTWAGEVWAVIVQRWNDAGPNFQKNFVQPIKDAWQSILDLLRSGWDATVQRWNDAGANFQKNFVQPIKDAWGSVAGWFKTNVTDPVVNWFSTAWEDIKGFFSGAWEFIVGIWNDVGTWFTTNVTDPVTAAFKTVLDWLGTTWNATFTGIGDFVKGTVNHIIDFINGMIRAIVGGINAVIGAMNALSINIPDWVPGIGGQTWGIHLGTVSAPQIPRLATGAVIPPNAQFAAILGDQRSGRNIETPEALLRQIFQEELGNLQVTSTLNVSGSMAAFVREMKPVFDSEVIRIGAGLIRNATTNPISIGGPG